MCHNNNNKTLKWHFKPHNCTATADVCIVTGASRRPRDCWGDRCPRESGGVAADNRCDSFSVWSRVSFYTTSEASGVWRLVHVAYFVVRSLQRLLSKSVDEY